MPQLPPSDVETRRALEKVVLSPGFVDAGRLPAFLRHIVERALDSETDRLKESVLGVEVFGRPADYDPRTDPIVRVEARRLRQRLDEYYAGLGKSDTIRISLPKGGYTPVFETVLPQPEAPKPIAWWKIPAAITVLALIGILLGYWQSGYMKRMKQAPVAAVAVLPFANLTTAPDTEYFSEGLTEELTDRLNRVPGLKVVPRTVMAQFKGRTADLASIAQSVRASVLVDGSVRQQAGRVRITARLLNPADGYQLWSETYERQLKDIFAIQEEIAQAIANALRVQVRGAPGSGHATANLDAYNNYLRGRYQTNLYAVDGLKRSIEFYEEALKKQPDYAPAAAGLSMSYAFLGYYRVLPSAEAWPKARRYADQAIALDANSAEAHAALGLELGWHEWKWKEAEAAFTKALQLDPASAIAHAMYSIAYLLPLGRLDEARAEMQKSLELDPVSTVANYVAAFIDLSAGRTNDAITRYRRTLELKNVHPDMWWDYGMALGFAGRYNEAREAYLKSRALRGAKPPDELGGLEAFFSGDPDKARRDLPPLEEAARAGRQAYMDLARLCAMLGESEKALAALTTALDHREEQVIWMKADPRLKSIRSEPRYLDLLKRLGLEG